MIISDLIQSIGIVVAIIGLILTILSNRKQLKLFNEQMKLQFFADYTKRYQELILQFPLSIFSDDFRFEAQSKEDQENILKYMRAYFDLCSEEYDLWKSGYVEERIWGNWKEGMEYAFAKPAFKQAWELVGLQTTYFSKFKNWINQVILKQKNNTES